MATAITVPVIFAVIWLVDRVKPQEWDAHQKPDKHGLYPEWGYKTKTALSMATFLTAFGFLLWVF